MPPSPSLSASTSSASETDAALYQYGPWLRASVYAYPGFIVVLAVFTAWGTADGVFAGEPPYMTVVWGAMVLSIVVNTYRSSNRYLSVVHLDDTCIRRTWPLKATRRLRTMTWAAFFLAG